jgi:hypothetical protein
MDAEVSTHTFLTMIIEESVCFMSSEPFLLLQLFLCGTHGIYIYFFSSTEHCAWAIISPKEFKSYLLPHWSFLHWENKIVSVSGIFSGPQVCWSWSLSVKCLCRRHAWLFPVKAATAFEPTLITTNKQKRCLPASSKFLEIGLRS